MLLSLYELSYKRPSVLCPTFYMKLTPVEVEKDGQIVYTSELKKFDFAEDISKYSSKDFSIANLISIGAYDMLQLCSTLSVPATTVVDYVESNLNLFENVQVSEK